jgi:hypothetical protein
LNAATKKILRELRLLPHFYRPAEERVDIERRLRGRDELYFLERSDCAIVSYGKSGRTWLRVLLSRFYQLHHGLAERHLLAFDNLHRRNPAIPVIHFTHDNYLKDFTGHADSKTDYYGKKVVLLARHPADVCVSQYFQWKFRMRERKKLINDYPGTELEIFDFLMRPQSGLEKIIDFMNLWAAEAERIAELHLLRYEDMRKDTEGELARLLAFIGTPGPAEEIREAVDYASIENMRKLEERRVFWLSGSRMMPKDRDNPDSYKVRRAKVGGFRDYFDDEQVARIETLVGTRLSPFYGYGGEDRAASA